MPKEVIEGYGPPDLIERVRNAAWTACAPSEKHFTGISLAGCLLVDTPDKFYSVKFRVTLEEVPQGDRFIVEGYNDLYLLDNIRRGYPPTKFTGRRLGDAPTDDTTAYRATIETVS